MAGQPKQFRCISPETLPTGAMETPHAYRGRLLHTGRARRKGALTERPLSGPRAGRGLWEGICTSLLRLYRLARGGLEAVRRLQRRAGHQRGRRHGGCLVDNLTTLVETPELGGTVVLSLSHLARHSHNTEPANKAGLHQSGGSAGATALVAVDWQPA